MAKQAVKKRYQYPIQMTYSELMGYLQAEIQGADPSGFMYRLRRQNAFTPEFMAFMDSEDEDE